MRKRPWINSKSQFKRKLREDIKRRILYDDGRLIIIDKDVGGTQNLIKLLGAMKAYESYAVYAKVGNNLRSIKCKDERILPTVLEKSGIKLVADAVDLRTATPLHYRFATEQDQFLFELKYGK